VKRYIIVIILLHSAGLILVAMGCEPQQFSIATYNINYGNPDLKLIVETIMQSGADFVALQETNSESEKYFKSHLSKLYPFMKFHRAAAAGGSAFCRNIVSMRKS